MCRDGCLSGDMAMTELTVEYLKHAVGEFDVETIFQASLASRSIHRIDALSQCSNLRWLDLSRNQIFRMENLDGLVHLMKLDLSHNKISKIQGLDGLDALEFLHVKNNPISRLEDLNGLRSVPKLQHLQLRNIDKTDFCPVCFQDQYKSRIYELVPGLVALDSQRKHLPDLDEQIARMHVSEEIVLPDPEPWFSEKDLDLSDIKSHDAFNAELQPHVKELETAMEDCQDALKEAEQLLKEHSSGQ